MRTFCLSLAVVALSATVCLGQSHQRASVSSGDKTVVGCVAIDAGGYSLKTEDGRTLPLHNGLTAGRDLSAYVGKRVQIHAVWQETGVTVATPLSSTEASPAAAGANPAQQHEFGGDLHLRLHGKVLGDCVGKSK